jgi:putative endonuclease
MRCYFYILQSQQDGTYYTGYTCDDLVERVAKHNRPHKGYTGKKRPWRLVYSEIFDTKKEAMAREKEVKGWKSRVLLEGLIQSKNFNRQ